MNLKCSVKKNVIYWLNRIDFQIQKIFPTRLAHPINKLRTRLFIGFATLSRNICCTWKSMWINLNYSLFYGKENAAKPNIISGNFSKPVHVGKGSGGRGANAFCFQTNCIHVNPPGSSGSLPEMEPDSRTPVSETGPPRCENTKKKKNFFFVFFLNNFPDHHFCAYVW